jgi:pimeloyl-ACP methyl ester carboxylesterase
MAQPILPRVSIPPFLDLPAGVTQQQVATDRGSYAILHNTSLLTTAQGTVLMVPGFTGSKEDFIALFEPLASVGLRGVAMDLSGQYESPVADGEQSSLTSFARDTWAVASTLPRPLVFVGHSFGGLVVTEAVLSDPLAVDGLVLVATGPSAIPEQQQQYLAHFAEVMSGFGLEAVWQGKRALDAAAGQPLPPTMIDEFLTRRFLSNDPRSLAAMIHTLCTAEDRTEMVAAVAPPTLVVIGGKDDVWPIAEQRTMASRLEATIVELPQAGHSPAVDDPAAVAGAIAEHFFGNA